MNLEEFLDECVVTTGAWWIKNNDTVWRNIFERFFGTSENGFDVRIGFSSVLGVSFEFAIGRVIKLN